MGRYFVCSLVFGLFSFCLGCGEPEKEQAHKQQNRPQAEDQQAPDNNQAPEKRQPAKRPRQKMPELVLEVPAASPGFAGKDLPPETPIPAEVQNKLETRGKERVVALAELLQSAPYPKIREDAASSMEYLDEPDRPQAILALRGALNDPNVDVAVEAAGIIRQWKAKDALKELIGLLYHPEEKLRERALEALEAIGPDAAPAAPQLFVALEDADYPSKEELIQVIGMLGPAGKPMIPRLLEYLQKPYSMGREAAIALGHLDEEEPLLLDLTNNNEDRRGNAAKGAKFLKKHSPEMIEALIQLANTEKDEFARHDVVLALGSIRPTTVPIVTAMFHGFATKMDWNRRELVEALGNCEPQFPEVSEMLIKVSKDDKDDSVRKLAAVTLSKFKVGPEKRLAAMLNQAISEDSVYLFSDGLKEKSDEILPLLLKMAADPQEKQPQRAAAILATQYLPYLKEEAERKTREETIQAVLRAIVQNPAEPPAVRAAALSELDDKKAITDETEIWLAGLQQSDSNIVRIKAASHIRHKPENFPTAVPVLVALLKNSNANLVEAAIEALPQFKEAADPAIPVILELLKDQNHTYCSRFLRALGEIGTQPAATVPVLEKFLKSEKYEAGTAAESLATVVSKNDLDATPFLPLIISRILQKEGYQRSDFLDAVQILGPKAASLIPQLLPLLEDKERSTRTATLRALANMGAQAEPAVPAILKAAADKNPQREDDVEEAIKALGKLKLGGAEFTKIAPDLLKNSKYKSLTLKTLEEYGVAAGAAAPAVAGLLREAESYDRGKLFELLLKFGPRAADAVAETVPFLKAKESYERVHALEFLGKIGPPAVEAVPAIKLLLEHETESNVRKAAVETLSIITPNDPGIAEIQMLDLLEMSDREIAKWLKKEGTSAQTKVRSGLASTNPKIRSISLSLLLKMKVPAAKAIPFFTKALANADVGVQRQAAVELSDLGQTSPQLTALLLGGLSEKNNRKYEQALQAAGSSAIPVLYKAMIAADDPEIRNELFGIIGILGRNRQSVPAEISAGLESPDNATREWTALTMVALGSNAEKPTQIVNGLLLQKDNPARDKAFQLVSHSLHRRKWKLPPENLEALLLEIDADDGVSFERERLLEANGLNDEQWKKLIARLPEMKDVSHTFSLMRRNKLPEPAVVAEKLLAFLQSEQPSRSYAVIEALRVLDTLDGLGEQTFLKLLSDEKTPVSLRCDVAVFLTETELTVALKQALEKLLTHDDPKLRGIAAAALAQNNNDWTNLSGPLFEFLELKDNKFDYLCTNTIRRGPAEQIVPILLKRVASAKEGSSEKWLNLLRYFVKTSPEARAYFLSQFTAATQESPEQVERTANWLKNVGTAGAKDLLAAMQRIAKPGAAHVKILRRQRWKDKDRAECLAWVLPLLQSENAVTQLQAALLVAELDPQNAAPVNILVKALNDAIAASSKDDSERDEQALINDILAALKELGPQSAPAVPALLTLIDPDDQSYFYRVMPIFEKLGPAGAPIVPRLIQMLDREHSFRTACQYLENLGPSAAAAIPALQTHLSNERRMQEAAAALAKIAPDESSYLPQLIAQVKNPALVYPTIEALGSLGSHGRQAVPVLIETLQSPALELKLAALGALNHLGENAQDAVEPLLALAQSKDRETQIAVLTTLGSLKASPEKCVPLLIAALDDPELQSIAIAALPQFGKEAHAALPALVKIITTPERGYLVIDALAQYQTPESFALLQQIAKGIDLPITEKKQQIRLRRTVINQLSFDRDRGKEAVPLLVELLNAEEPLRQTAAQALSRIDPGEAKAKGVYRTQEDYDNTDDDD
jgi:HEAT repeat protein